MKPKSENFRALVSCIIASEAPSSGTHCTLICHLNTITPWRRRCFVLRRRNVLDDSWNTVLDYGLGNNLSCRIALCLWDCHSLVRRSFWCVTPQVQSTSETVGTLAEFVLPFLRAELQRCLRFACGILGHVCQDLQTRIYVGIDA